MISPLSNPGRANLPAKVGNRPGTLKRLAPAVLLRMSFLVVKMIDKLSPGFLSSTNINFQKHLLPYLNATEMFNYLANGIYVIRASDGEVVYANDAARSLFSMKGSRKANLLELFTKDSVVAAFDRINNSSVDDPREDLHLTMKRKDGAEFPVETIPRKVRFADGTYIVGGIKFSMLAAIQELFAKVATMNTEEEVCQTVIEHAMNLFRIDAASIKVRDLTGEFRMIAGSGLDGKEVLAMNGERAEVDVYRPRPDARVEDTATYIASKTGKTVETPELAETTSSAFKLGMRSRMVVALRAIIGKNASGVTIHDEIGAFCIYTRTPERFKSLQRNIKYLEMFAQIASHKIREARLYAQEQHQKVCKELLNMIAQAINLPLELNEVLNVLVVESEKMFKELKGEENIRSCSVYMPEKGSDFLKLMAAVGRAEEDIDIKIGDGSVMGQVAETKRPIFVEDAGEHFADSARRGSFLCIPILIGGKLLGILNIASNEKRTFDRIVDEPVIRTLAEMAGTAIEKAKLLAETRDLKNKYQFQTLLDQLVPELISHGTAEVILVREMEKAKALSLPLSLVYLDIDDFKTINDTKGHLEGTKKIKHVGRIVSEFKAATIFPCKFGGDEFLLIMADVDKEAALRTAKELQERIEQEVNLSVTIGISSFPSDADNLKDLINMADTKKKYQKGIIIPA